MGIKNTKIGGLDFTTPTARVKPTDLNDTNDAIINQNITTAELAVRTLQANNIFINGPNIVVDETTDANGTKNTINTTSSTAFYNANASNASGLYYTLYFTDEASGDTTHEYTETDSWSNVSNAFDNDDGTYAQMLRTTNTTDNTVDSALGKTFASSRYISYVKIKASWSMAVGDESSKAIIIQTYNGSIWSTESTLVSGSGAISYDDIYFLDSTVDGIRIYYDYPDNTNNKQWDRKLYTLEYGDYDSSDTIIADTGTTTLDGNELGFAISTPDVSLPTNTSMTVTISDGTNSLSPATIDTVSKGIVVGNDGTLSSGTLKITFTLTTTDTSVTPTFDDYGVVILR